VTRLKDAERYQLDLKSCPDLPRTQRGVLAEQGVRDALTLVGDVREVDPRAVWGRLTRWSRVDPARLVMLVVALAALVDPEVEPRTALAWTDGLAKGAA
jgi:hypothetical protein